MPDCDETFGGGQGDGQERLSPEPAQSVKVRARKGREIQILAVSPFEKAVVLASFSALYGWQVVPNAIWWCQVVLGGPWVLPGGCLVVIGHKLKVLESLVKGVVCPLAPRGGFGGSSPHSRA